MYVQGSENMDRGRNNSRVGKGNSTCLEDIITLSRSCVDYGLLRRFGIGAIVGFGGNECT